MVAKGGIEPPTHGFSVRCSTICQRFRPISVCSYEFPYSASAPSHHLQIYTGSKSHRTEGAKAGQVHCLAGLQGEDDLLIESRDHIFGFALADTDVLAQRGGEVGLGFVVLLENWAGKP